jgi:ribosome-associated protein
MDIRKLQKAIVDGLEDVKAQNIVVFNTEALSPLFERVIIASGTSNRQTKALAASVRDSVKGLGEPIPRMEGEENGEWIIVDCGAAVAHIMQPAIRDYYHLEEIWGMKPVALKAAVKKARSGLPKAEEAPAAPSRRTPGKATRVAEAKSSGATAPARAKRVSAAPAARGTASAPKASSSRARPTSEKAARTASPKAATPPATKAPSQTARKPAPKAAAKAAPTVATKAASGPAKKPGVKRVTRSAAGGTVKTPAKRVSTLPAKSAKPAAKRAKRTG